VPETLSYQIDLNCPIGADVRHEDWDYPEPESWFPAPPPGEVTW